MIRHLLCYQELAVACYGFALDAANMAHPLLSLKGGIMPVLCKNSSAIKTTIYAGLAEKRDDFLSGNHKFR